MRLPLSFYQAARGTASIVTAMLVLTPATRANAQAPSAMVQRGVNAIGGDAALRASSNTTYEFDAAVCGIGQEETSRPRLAYVQSRRVRGVADVIQPGPGMSPVGSHEVVAMVRARGVTVDRVVGAHSGSVRWSEEVAAAAR